MSTWSATLVLLAGYVVTAGAMLLYAEHFVSARVDSDLFPLPWVADGIAVSLMLLWGTRTWPGVLIGSICIWGALRGDPAILVGVDALGETAGVLITVHLLRALHFRRQLDRLADPVILVAAAIAGRVIAGLADVAGTVAGIWLTPRSIDPEFVRMATVPGTLVPGITWGLVSALSRWELNAIAGIVLTVPVLLVSPRTLRHAVRARPLRLAALGAGALAWAVAAFALAAPWACWPLLLAALMLVAWAAIEFSALAAALCTLLFSLTAAAAFCQSAGPLASTDPLGGLAATWGFIGLLCCVSPVLTVLLTTRQHHDRHLSVLAERYQSLFTANPTPAWVVDAKSGAILMANVEAIRRYGYSEAEFLAMRMADLGAEGPAAAQPEPPEGDLVAAPLVKHVTRDGRLIDVELVATPLELDGRPVSLLHAVDLTDHQDLRRRLLATVDRESCRVSQELHDGLGQVLAGLAIGSEALLQRTAQTRLFDAQGVAQLRELTHHAQAAESHLFQLTSGVSPLEELQGDLLEALRRLPGMLPATERARVEVIIEDTAPVTLSLERREHLYRVVQESLANALKHARAQRIVIRAAIDADRIRVAVEDDGVGLQEEQNGGAGLGLQSMRLRASAVGADLALLNLRGGGTAVSCSCPQAEPLAATPSVRARRCDRPAACATSGGEARPPSQLAYLASAAVIVLTCWIGAAISHALASAHHRGFTYADAQLAVPSLLAGAAVCGLLLGGTRQWPAVLLGLTLMRYGLVGEPLPTAFVLACTSAAGCYAIVAVLRRWSFAPSLDRWQDPLVLCAAAGLAWALAAVLGLLAMIVLTAAGAQVAPGVRALYSSSANGLGLHMTPALLWAEIRWWFDALTGTVLLVPTLTLFAASRRVLRANLTELCAWLACLGGWAFLLLAVNTDRLLLPLLTLSILLVVWAAARLGVAFASLATLTFAMVAAASFSTGTGALATQAAAAGVTYVWGMVGVHTVIGLFLAALLAEHQARHRKIAAVNKRYRSLFQGDPRPLWLHDIRTGEILDANEPAARAYGYTMEEFTKLRVQELFAPGASGEQLSAGGESAVGPVPMRHQRKSGDTMDMDMWSYGTFLDGRRVSICFAHDVTERNTLRRLLFDRAELERRQLAAELRRVLAGPLAELRIVAHKLLLEFGRQASPARMRELLESLARQARRTAGRCREAAHQLSPLQANGGDLVAALHALQRQTPAAPVLEIRVEGDAPLALGQQQTENVYGLLSELVKRCPADPAGAAVRLAIAHLGSVLRLTLETALPRSSAAPATSLARHPSVLLRVRAMGARLWERPLGGAQSRVVCDCPLQCPTGVS
ncbi:MAG TPA: PAS domain S-box protein [Steroidobacteraceae bacterium]|nr:PAS domain S-box protein [Steroidobacteraceae bacterium]